jgi:hypothetical protein
VILPRVAKVRERERTALQEKLSIQSGSVQRFMRIR